MVMEILGKTTFGKEAEEVGVYGTYKDYAGEGLTYATELAGLSVTHEGASTSGLGLTTGFCGLYSSGQNKELTCVGLRASHTTTTESGYVEIYSQAVMLRHYDTAFQMTITYSCNGGSSSSNTIASSVSGNTSSVVLPIGSSTKDCILSYDGTNYDVTFDGTLISRNNSLKYKLSFAGYSGGSITPTKIVVNSGKAIFLKSLNF